jgi:hypothetical protein
MIRSPTSIFRLAKQACHRMLAVLASTRIDELIADHAGQPEGSIEFAVGNRSRVERNFGTLEIQLQRRSIPASKAVLAGFLALHLAASVEECGAPRRTPG